MVTTISEKLPPFTGAREGFVSKAYKDAGGVLTIGHGFTSGSKIFSDYWMQSRGHKLRAGDTITMEESLMLLSKTLSQEYAPPVLKRFGANLPAHQFDGASDYSYNCGPGGLNDSWTALLAKGDIAGAVAKLKTSRITAGGKTLSGLINRRAAEGKLIQNADYGTIGEPSLSTSAADVKAYQTDLKTLGYYTGAIDGIAGMQTQAAVKKFQTDQGLVVDGKVGPATRAALTRAKAARAGVVTAVVAGPTGAAASPVVEPTTVDQISAWSGINLLIGAAVAVAIVVIIFVIWQNRGRILGKRTPS
jgi:lysozyme